MKTERLPDGQIKLTLNVWHDVFPEDRLDSWIQWYEAMAKDYKQPRYLEIAAALKAVKV